MSAPGPGPGARAGQQRAVLLVVHTGRPDGVNAARSVVKRLASAGVTVRVLDAEADDLRCTDAVVVPAAAAAAEGAEMVLVIGGDGTLLRAAELARPAGTPLLGVNHGHVGFLAATEPDVLDDAVESVLARGYVVEPRMTVDVVVRHNGDAMATAWALNEATVEKAARERMVDLVTEVDGRPLSRWGCDGMVFATPTGSTAYAFSAGGPVVWPDVEALLLVPISAHALFAGPMVVSPESVLAVEIIATSGGHAVGRRLAGARDEAVGAVLWCDGRRMVDLPPGARVEVRRGAKPVLLARLRAVGGGGSVAGGEDAGIGASFTDRLVAKFGLPVAGWRGRGAARPRPPSRGERAALRGDRARGDEEPAGDA